MGEKPLEIGQFEITPEEFDRRLIALEDLETQAIPYDLGEILIPLSDAMGEDLSALDRMNLDDTIQTLIKMRNARKDDRVRPVDLNEAEIRVLDRIIHAFQNKQDEDVVDITEDRSIKDMNRES